MTKSNEVEFITNYVSDKELSYKKYAELSEYIIMDVEFDGNQRPYSIYAVHYKDGEPYRVFDGWAGNGTLSPIKMVCVMAHNSSKTFAQVQEMTVEKLVTDYYIWLSAKMREDVPIIGYDMQFDSKALGKVVQHQVSNPAYDMIRMVRKLIGTAPTLGVYRSLLVGESTSQNQFTFNNFTTKAGELHLASYDVHLVQDIILAYHNLVDIK